MAPMTPEESYQQVMGGAQEATEQEVTEPTQQEQGGEQQPAESAAPKTNPNWDEAWTDVPEPIRNNQRAVFEKWDANYNQLQARHAPYAEYEKRGYNPEYISGAIALQQALQQDPQGFVDYIADQLGISAQAAQQVAQQVQQDEETFQTPEMAELTQLRAQVEQLTGFQQQEAQAREQHRIQQQYVEQVTGSLANLHGKYGDFDEDRVVRQAMINAQMGGNADLEVALNEIRAYEAEVVRRASRTAPNVLGNAGGTGAFTSAPEERKLATPEELRAKAMEMARQFTENR